MKINKKSLSLFVASSLLLVACGTTDLNSETESVSETTTSSMISSSVSESVPSSVESESSESNSISESNSSEVESEEETELNHDEAAMIERAKEKITELTGYVEGDEYLYLIDGVEGSIVSINVRENGEEVASSSGFYQYDDRTDSLQEMDVLTGEYEDFPANE
ncbi:hypothetical protein LZ578_05645 [Jeotgalibaca sp. MA1X17-3]|uniref:hypothetical protein n=1 Tax=Jeotgalibaca sp. MA1X17-3 TaxID=2908211 RepID=UPI001F39EE18|nr:hypothetical protein [Jeotgalibaca sp. MA1X17-3]UJF16573.1 hypothetical protein LZ578_05645 [Jeotgalibaca sp. MA1X17-3]